MQTRSFSRRIFQLLVFSRKMLFQHSWRHVVQIQSISFNCNIYRIEGEREDVIALVASSERGKSSPLDVQTNRQPFGTRALLFCCFVESCSVISIWAEDEFNCTRAERFSKLFCFEVSNSRVSTILST